MHCEGKNLAWSLGLHGVSGLQGKRGNNIQVIKGKHE